MLLIGQGGQVRWTARAGWTATPTWNGRRSHSAATSGWPTGAARSSASCGVRRALRPWCCSTAGRRPPTSTGGRQLRAAGPALQRRRPRSPRPRARDHAAAPFRLEQCADDVAALAAALGLEQIIPVGYSMGGPIAQLVWRRHRDLVAGLVLCATSASFVGTRRERLLQGVATGTSAIAGTVPLGRLTSAALGKWTGWRGRRSSTWWGFEEVARHDWAQVLEAGRETLRFDSRRWIGQVDVPTAVVVNDDDGVVPTRRQRALAASIPRRLGVDRPRRARRVHDVAGAVRAVAGRCLLRGERRCARRRAEPPRHRRVSPPAGQTAGWHEWRSSDWA